MTCRLNLIPSIRVFDSESDRAKKKQESNVTRRLQTNSCSQGLALFTEIKTGKYQSWKEGQCLSGERNVLKHFVLGRKVLLPALSLISGLQSSLLLSKFDISILSCHWWFVISFYPCKGMSYPLQRFSLSVTCIWNDTRKLQRLASSLLWRNMITNVFVFVHLKIKMADLLIRVTANCLFFSVHFVESSECFVGTLYLSWRKPCFTLFYWLLTW